MPSLRNISIRKFYDSDRDNLLAEFLIPVLSAAKKYQRLTGFFSSGILAAAARGIAELIRSEGKMQLIVGAQVHDEDFQAIQRATINPEFYATQLLMVELEKVITDDHVEALGWMLANNLLEIRIALSPEGGMFHMKVGIVEDSAGDKLSFSGSDNETPSGWKHNIEEFKVFRSWQSEERDWFNADDEKFNRFWTNRAARVYVIELPEAMRRQLIKLVPKRRDDLKIFKKQQKRGFNPQMKDSPNIVLRKNQEQAVKAWMDHGGKGILSMATGSGKTKASLAVVHELRKEKAPLLIIVALPYSHLVDQWIKNDIYPQFPRASIIEAHGGATGWPEKLGLFLESYKKGIASDEIFVVTLYDTLCSQNFINKVKSLHSNKLNYLLIADEVHNLGASENSRGMLEEYNLRLGLSATPSRHFDEDGTEKILNYFNGVVYEYGIKEAISDGYLVHYQYHPLFIEMTDDEYRKYHELSLDIARKFASGMNAGIKIKENVFLQKLLIGRSKILKQSKGKIGASKELLERLNSKNELDHTLVYCDDINQLGEIQSILGDLGIPNHKFTQAESMRQRREILENFSAGIYKVLVAIKCLDEGVDVPSIKTAIILASTTNPREYIQRRGRVLRKDPSKKEATIYDFVVIPPKTLASNIMDVDKKILTSEFERVSDFLETADNKSEIYTLLLKIMDRYKLYI